MSIRIMNEVIEAAPVEQGALLVMIMLADSADEHSRQCWPSISTIARRSRLSERQVQYCLKDLAASGLVDVEPNAGRSGTNLYRITKPETWGGAKTAGVKPIAPGGVQSTSPGGVKPIAPEPSYEPSIEPSKEPLLFPSQEQPKKDLTEAFERFWSKYPKKVGRPQARERFAKAVRAGADPEKIITAAAAYAKSETVAKGFIKHPQGWLSEERFNDPDLQPAPPRVRPGPAWGEVVR